MCLEYIQRRCTVRERLQMQTVKVLADPNKKVRITLSGSELNVIQNLIEKHLEDEKHKNDSYFWMNLRGKLNNKQLKNSK